MAVGAPAVTDDAATTRATTCADIATVTIAASCVVAVAVTAATVAPATAFLAAPAAFAVLLSLHSLLLTRQQLVAASVSSGFGEALCKGSCRGPLKIT